jgi:CTP:molybdopterin cytidylyltransferase MocA
MMAAIVQKFISTEIDKALFRRGLPHDSPVRPDLETRAEVCGGREVVVLVRDESGRSITLDDRLEQLKRDSNYCDCFPADAPCISRHDEKKMHDNFEKIALGEVVVESSRGTGN